MCRLYTGAFINGGLLDAQGRKPYSDVSTDEYCSLDLHRAADEIALIDRKTGEVTYGIDSLIRIITHRWPVLSPLLMTAPVRWLLEHLYAFVSYNRKVIAAVKPTGKPCNPSYHSGYRIAYLVIAFAVVSLILTTYTAYMADLLPAGHLAREYFVCGGQIIFQGAILLVYRRSRLMDYLGNMMTVSLMGALALLPLLMLSNWLQLSPLVYAAYFLLVAGGMLLEHLRRMKLLGLGYLPSVTWVIYRALVLLAIFCL